MEIPPEIILKSWVQMISPQIAGWCLVPPPATLRGFLWHVLGSESVFCALAIVGGIIFKVEPTENEVDSNPK